VPQADAALRPRDVLQLLLPPRRVGVGYLLLADQLVEHEVKQTVLAADVPVQRRRAGTELLGEPPHAQRGQALAVEQADGRGHDGLPADRVAPAPARPVGQPLPGRRRDPRFGVRRARVRVIRCDALSLRRHLDLRLLRRA
jgi:hypothetical protein